MMMKISPSEEEKIEAGCAAPGKTVCMLAQMVSDLPISDEEKDRLWKEIMHVAFPEQFDEEE